MALELHSLRRQTEADERPGRYRLRNKLWFTEGGEVVLDGDDRARFLIGPAGRDLNRKFAVEQGIIAFETELSGDEPETAEQLVTRNTRDQLLVIAEAEGVEFDADGTKPVIAEAIVAARAAGSPAEE